MTAIQENSKPKLQPHTGLLCLVVVAKSLGIILDEKKFQAECKKENKDIAALLASVRELNLKGKHVDVKPEDEWQIRNALLRISRLTEYQHMPRLLV